ncbi:MAG: hypothetical protein AAGG01_10595 [Planctomycetota bacterium]
MRRPRQTLTVLFTLLFAACAASPSDADGPEPVSAPEASAAKEPAWRVTIEVDAAEQLARVRATLGPLPESDVPDAVDFAFARRFAFVTLPPAFVEPPVAWSIDKTLDIDRTDPFRLRVETEGRRDLELTYAIALNQRTHPEVVAGTDQYEHSFVTADQGMLFTAELVPSPDVALDTVEVRFAGDHASSVITPWTARSMDGSRPESADVDRVWTPRRSELGDDIVLLGEGWRTIEAEARGLQATFALHPDAAWLAPLAEEIFVPIVEAEVDLFERAPRERYLFVFGPADGVRGYGGSPKTGSMTLFAASNLPEFQARQGLAHLIAHEFHHVFGRTGARSSDDLRFVTEGYTDYYAYIVPWRLGMIDDASLHKRLERKISEGAQALAKYQQSLALAGGPEFFAGREAYQACYAAGLTLALWTDLALRKAKAGTLDELMREWYAPGDANQRSLRAWRETLTERLRAADALAYMNAVETVDEIDWEELFDRVNIVVEQVGDSFQVSPTVIDRIR